MSKRHKHRTSNFSDRAVQGSLLIRIIGHWAAVLVMTGSLLVFVELMSGNPLGNPSRVFQNLQSRYWPTMLAIVLLAPICILDLCRLSNRFAGPMVRLRRAMRDLAAGREVSPIKFRENDFWHDLADEFNQVLARCQPTESGPPEDDAADRCVETVDVESDQVPVLQ